jgi:hypothetical protein
MPDSGLAQFIAISEIVIVLGGVLLAVLLSRILARRLGWSGAKFLLATLAFCVIGFGGGVLAVIATFYEDTWAPRPEVTFKVPPGFTQYWVILLEDRSSSVQLVWTGVEIPFFGKKTLIEVPSSGIVRLRDLNMICCRPRVVWSDGKITTSGGGSGPAPESTGATHFVIFNRVDPGSSPDPERDYPPKDEALGAYIAERERGAP